MSLCAAGCILQANLTSLDATVGATGAPKFSDTFTLFQPGGADSAPPSQKLHQIFPRGYISAGMVMSEMNKLNLITIRKDFIIEWLEVW